MAHFSEILALPCHRHLVMISWVMRHLWFDAENQALSPRVGPAWQTDNLQSSGFIHFFSFKGRADVSLMRKSAYQYMLSFICLFLFPFPLKKHWYRLFFILQLQNLPPICFLQYKQPWGSNQTQLFMKGAWGRTVTTISTETEFGNEKDVKIYDIWLIRFCLQVRSY